MLDAREFAAQLQQAQPRDRLAVITKLPSAFRADATSNVDEFLEVLRPPSRPPTWDEDPNVRKATHETIRALAGLRGERRGLRNVVPAGTDLTQLENGRLFWGGISLVWDAVSIYGGPDVLEAGLRWATEPQRGLYATWWTRSEVGNGGFSQYFWNDTGIIAPHAVRGLRAIGAPALAEVVDQAMKVFGPEFPLWRPQRMDALERLPSGTFDALDHAFYGEAKTLDERAGAFVRNHLASFFEV